MASSCLGDRKKVQDARFDSHLTGVKKKVFIGARNRNAGVFWKPDIVCLEVVSIFPPFILVKKHCKRQRSFSR